jgi:hypothetical protein
LLEFEHGQPNGPLFSSCAASFPARIPSLCRQLQAREQRS